MTDYYVERSVNGRQEWLRIADGTMWTGSFCVLGEIPEEHKPS